MTLMKILSKSKKEIAKMPLCEFWELLKYYNDPKKYMQNQYTDEQIEQMTLDTMKDLSELQR